MAGTLDQVSAHNCQLSVRSQSSQVVKEEMGDLSEYEEEPLPKPDDAELTLINNDRNFDVQDDFFHNSPKRRKVDNDTAQNRKELEKMNKVCKYCKVPFRRVQTLGAHLWTKHGENYLGFTMYLCTSCDKNFKLKKYLDDHIRRHH